MEEKVSICDTDGVEVIHVVRTVRLGSNFEIRVGLRESCYRHRGDRSGQEQCSKTEALHCAPPVMRSKVEAGAVTLNATDEIVAVLVATVSSKTVI